ncbi:MAG: glucosamine-6-phosphate deaminase [Eubacteriales bacterium]|nr:glucosamine-6-phosphate deaminase [Clostridiales bacterium]MDY5836194.1 glucosamine-6-phosphate deaminase [Eubacteriales bacterium]
MEIQVFDSYEEMSINAARLVAAQVRLKPDSVLGLATGSTPLGLYAELIRMYEEENLDFSEVVTLNLDEYLGLGPDDDQSYAYFMREKLFSKINIDPDSSYLPDGLAEDPEDAAQEYEMLADMLPRDLQILGIGRNGHIGFNEPADAFPVETHVTDLAESTIQANQRFFDNADQVPRQAITMGMKQILAAKKIILLASGADKAETISDLVFGKVTSQVPASILNLHPDVMVMLDEAAARYLVEAYGFDDEDIAGE